MPIDHIPPDPPAPTGIANRTRWHWGFGLVPPLMLVWLALNGNDAWPLGLAAALAAAAVGALLVPGEPYPWRAVRLIPFCVYFFRRSFRGGIDVAWRALHPALPIDPAWIEFRLKLPPGQPRTLMIGLVNLLPGSLVAELLPDDNLLRVHVLTRESDPDLGGLEAQVAQLFGLQLPPAP
jgi:multicomponent Na+:H+ antiporter subunit E